MDPNRLQDIATRPAIEQMVDSFYETIREDELLGPIFNEVIGDRWGEHLPKMYRFWSSILLGEGSYHGQPFPKHLPLPIETRHFDRWVGLFEANVDTQFAGPQAEEAKHRARTIANIFQHKLGLISMPGASKPSIK